MLLGFLIAAAEQSRDLHVPPAERVLGQALFPSRIDRDDAFEFLSDSRTILQALPHAERLSERAHVGGQPEMRLRPIGRKLSGGFASPEATLESSTSFCFRTVRPQPVADPRQLPSCLVIGGRVRFPQIRGAPG